MNAVTVAPPNLRQRYASPFSSKNLLPPNVSKPVPSKAQRVLEEVFEPYDGKEIAARSFAPCFVCGCPTCSVGSPDFGVSFVFFDFSFSYTCADLEQDGRDGKIASPICNYLLDNDYILAGCDCQPPPSESPSLAPSNAPSGAPSYIPSYAPSVAPSNEPSVVPSEKPSEEPSEMPSGAPSTMPSGAPSGTPSEEPSVSVAPSYAPSYSPSTQPSREPSEVPSEAPSQAPTKDESEAPSYFPSDSPTPAPTPEPCFSGHTTVNVQNKGATRMEDLIIGDVVQVDSNQYEPVYSFCKKNHKEWAEFRSIKTKDMLKPLEVSTTHLLFVEGHRATVPAAQISVGDRIRLVDNTYSSVEAIKTIHRKGYFAPYTYSGKIVVNDGVVASTFAVLPEQPSGYLEVGNYETPVSFQNWFWFTQSYHRLLCKWNWNICAEESYEGDGMSTIVGALKPFYEWWMGQSTFVVALIMIPVAGGLAVLSLLEFLLENHAILAIAGFATLFWWSRRGSWSLAK